MRFYAPFGDDAERGSDRRVVLLFSRRFHTNITTRVGTSNATSGLRTFMA